MGVEINAAALLAKVRAEGADFRRVLMLGRQQLLLDPKAYSRLLAKLGKSRQGCSPAYADEFFQALGARQVESMDYSTYEGSQIIHDLNQPIPPELRESYDLVFDGGTLEHVFNFPVALKNCMEMLRVGGRLIIATIPNNWCGHGFYQFSPELFYRALSAENGFKTVEMYITDLRGGAYAVPDPAEKHSRIELRNSEQVFLLVHARREEVRPIFAIPPQQSDYVAMWRNHPSASGTSSILKRWLKKIPLLQLLVARHRQRGFRNQASLRNHSVYTRVDLQKWIR